MINIDDRLIKEISPRIGPNALSALLAISIHLNKKTDRAFPSHERLMSLTGMGKNALYDAISVLKKEGLLTVEQQYDNRTKRFSRRDFKVNTALISVFIPANDIEPLPDFREPAFREPAFREPEIGNLNIVNNLEQIINEEQVNKEEEDAQARNISDPQNNQLEAIGDNAPPPIARRPPHDFTRVDVDLEAEKMLSDSAFLMSFSSRGLPTEKAGDYVRAFCVDVKGRGENYNRIRDFRSHCLNWCERRHNINKAKAPAQGPNQKMRVI